MQINHCVKSVIEKKLINFDESVTVENREKLLKIIDKYRDVFALNLKELGKTNVVEMEIKLKDKKTIKYHPYKVAYGIKSELNNQIDELLQMDIIQESVSEYASPVLFVPKKNENIECVLTIES